MKDTFLIDSVKCRNLMPWCLQINDRKTITSLWRGKKERERQQKIDKEKKRGKRERGTFSCLVFTYCSVADHSAICMSLAQAVVTELESLVAGRVKVEL